MKKSIMLLAFCWLALVAPSYSFSMPMQYEVFFDGEIGNSGNGTFSWDNDTGSFSDFVWNLGEFSGGIDESRINIEAIVFSGPWSQLIFEILTLQDVHPADCSEIGGSCGTASGATFGDFESFNFNVHNDNRQTYAFRNGGVVVASGNFNTSLLVKVNAPATYLLILIGLFGLLTKINDSPV